MFKGSASFLLGLTASLVLLQGNTAMAHTTDGHPVVLELFTAQGCDGCPAANATVERISRDPKVIVLTYGVDYWDYLGWRDTFARPEFGARQRTYRHTLGQRSVSTPQIIIQGQRPLTPRTAPEVDDAVANLSTYTLPPPDIEFRQTGDRVAVGSGRTPEGGAEVIAIRYAPGVQTVQVRAGDNQGQSVPHINVVKEIQHLGEWNGRASLYPLPQQMTASALDNDAVVVMVQAKRDRRILTVARLPEQRHD